MVGVVLEESGTFFGAVAMAGITRASPRRETWVRRMVTVDGVAKCGYNLLCRLRTKKDTFIFPYLRVILYEGCRVLYTLFCKKCSMRLKACWACYAQKDIKPRTICM